MKWASRLVFLWWVSEGEPGLTRVGPTGLQTRKVRRAIQSWGGGVGGLSGDGLSELERDPALDPRDRSEEVLVVELVGGCPDLMVWFWVLRSGLVNEASLTHSA